MHIQHMTNIVLVFNTFILSICDLFIVKMHIVVKIPTLLVELKNTITHDKCVFHEWNGLKIAS